MNTGLLIRTHIMAVVALVVFALGQASAGADKVPVGGAPLLTKLLKAVEANDYTAFVADGNALFKAGMTPQMLEGVSAQLASRMKAGYQKTYLGELRQQGCAVYLWKLVFKDRGDDVLAKLTLQDGKVAGMWLQ